MKNLTRVELIKKYQLTINELIHNKISQALNEFDSPSTIFYSRLINNVTVNFDNRDVRHSPL